MKLFAKMLLVAFLYTSTAAYAGDRYQYGSLYKINQKRKEMFLTVAGDTLFLEIRVVDMPTFFVDIDTLLFDHSEGHYVGRNTRICKPEGGYYELTLKEPVREGYFRHFKAFALFRKATSEEYESYMSYQVQALKAKTETIFFLEVNDAGINAGQKDSLRAYSNELYRKISHYTESHTFSELLIYNQQVVSEFRITAARLSGTKE
ncbi:hypothetical protein D3C72_594210 [compost metagenome]